MISRCDVALVFFILYVILIVGCIVYAVVKGSANEPLSAGAINELRDIITHFHEEPDFDDFISVYNARDKLDYYNAKRVRFWLWGVYLCYPDFFNAARRRVLEGYMREIERGLRRVKTNPTIELVDCVWALYFATGNPDYADIVRDIALDCPAANVALFATWTYTDVIGAAPERPA